MVNLMQAQQFLTDLRQRDQLLNCVLSWLGTTGEPILFGGAIRDLILNGPHDARPRDCDFVVDRVDTTEIERFLSQRRFLYDRNKFGGFQVKVSTTKIDLWALNSTWAFREGLVKACAENLPLTVFLNADAVAMRVSDGMVYGSQFFEAARSRVLDLVLVPNPRPELNILRALVLQQQYGFRLSSRLWSYIAHWYNREQNPIATLRELENRRYGKRIVSDQVLIRAMDGPTPSVGDGVHSIKGSVPSPAMELAIHQ